MIALVCDIGGTRIKLGLVRQGQVLARDVIPSQSEGGLAGRLPSLAEAFRRLCAGNGFELAQCSGLCMSVPSLVDPVSGRALAEYGCFRDMPNLDLRAWAWAEFGLPFTLENDARMAAIGEWRHGAGRGCDNFAMVTLGTGLGTGVVLEGRVLRGSHGQAGVLGGHFTVLYNGRTCACGNIGCAEAEASTKVLAELAAAQPDFSVSALSREPLVDFEAIFRQADLGDSCATTIRDHCIRVWSALAVTLVHAYDLELIVLGGGIMASAGVIQPAIEKYVHLHAHTPWGRVRVVQSELGDDAALIAGEWLLQEQASHLL